MAVQGFGAVGRNAARFLVEWGGAGGRLRLGRAVVNPAGLDVAALAAGKAEGGSVASFAGGVPIPRDDLLGVDCELLVPAARPEVLTAANADQVRARVILEGANIPATAEAEQLFHWRGMLVGRTSSPTPAGSSRAVEHRGDTQAHALALVRRRSAPTPACRPGSASSASCRGRRPRSWPAPASPSHRLPPQMVNGPVPTLDSRVEKEAPYMRPLTTQELVALADERDGPCVSINLPTHGPGGEQQDPIRLREPAPGGRTPAGWPVAPFPDQGSARPRPAAGLRRRLRREAAAGGLAIALAGDGPRRLRLPYRPRELVGRDRFHVKPLLPLLWGWPVLPAGAQPAPGAAVRGRPGRPARAELHDVPAGLAEAMRLEDREEQLQLHQTGPARPGGRPAAVFHGHGVGADDAKDRILRFFRDVDHGVQRALGNGRAPLVLAAVDYLRPLYRAASSYPQILEQGLSGNPDHLGAHDLHRRAWTLVGHRFRSDQQAVAVRCRALERRGRATSDLRRIVPAAVGGRVESLLVPMGAEQWGSVDPATGAAQLHRRWRPGDVDLLDLAAVETAAAARPTRSRRRGPTGGSPPLLNQPDFGFVFGLSIVFERIQGEHPCQAAGAVLTIDDRMPRSACCPMG